MSATGVCPLNHRQDGGQWLGCQLQGSFLYYHNKCYYLSSFPHYILCIVHCQHILAYPYIYRQNFLGAFWCVTSVWLSGRSVSALFIYTHFEKHCMTQLGSVRREKAGESSWKGQCAKSTIKLGSCSMNSLPSSELTLHTYIHTFSLNRLF